MSEEKYTLVVKPLSEEDGGGYIAFAPDLPGCLADGETQEEAIRELRSVIADWIEIQRERGRQVPEPGAAKQRAEAERKAMQDQIDDLLKLDHRLEKLEGEMSEQREILDHISAQRRFDRTFVSLELFDCDENGLTSS